MKTDIEIAQQAELKRITEIAIERLGIPEEHIEPYGHYKAKLTNEFVGSLGVRVLILLALVRVKALVVSFPPILPFGGPAKRS